MKRIIKYMGWNKFPNSYNEQVKRDNSYRFVCSFDYDSSYDSIMEVVDKIESEGYYIDIGINVTSINLFKHRKKYIKGFGKNRLESTYNCIINFIEYHESF